MSFDKGNIAAAATPMSFDKGIVAADAAPMLFDKGIVAANAEPMSFDKGDVASAADTRSKAQMRVPVAASRDPLDRYPSSVVMIPGPEGFRRGRGGVTFRITTPDGQARHVCVCGRYYYKTSDVTLHRNQVNPTWRCPLKEIQWVVGTPHPLSIPKAACKCGHLCRNHHELLVHKSLCNFFQKEIDDKPYVSLPGMCMGLQH